MFTKKSSIYIAVMLVAGVVAVGVWFAMSGAPDTTPTLPTGYTLSEMTDVACERSDECSIPMEYAIRSDCPYTSMCLNKKCAVVCPSF